MKSENSSPQASPSSTRTNTSRTAFARPGPHVPQAISEGRRLYVGNMPYTAKTEDVEALFTAAEFPMYATQAKSPRPGLAHEVPKCVMASTET